MRAGTGNHTREKEDSTVETGPGRKENIFNQRAKDQITMNQDMNNFRVQTWQCGHGDVFSTICKDFVIWLLATDRLA